MEVIRLFALFASCPISRGTGLSFTPASSPLSHVSRQPHGGLIVIQMSKAAMLSDSYRLPNLDAFAIRDATYKEVVCQSCSEPEDFLIYQSFLGVDLTLLAQPFIRQYFTALDLAPCQLYVNVYRFLISLINIYKEQGWQITVHQVMRYYSLHPFQGSPDAFFLNPQRRRVIHGIMDDDRHWNGLPLVVYGDVWGEGEMAVIHRGIRSRFNLDVSRFGEDTGEDHLAEIMAMPLYDRSVDRLIYREMEVVKVATPMSKIKLESCSRSLRRSSRKRGNSEDGDSSEGGPGPVSEVSSSKDGVGVRSHRRLFIETSRKVRFYLFGVRFGVVV